MSLKGFAVLYGDQMSELGMTTDEIFQQKSLFDFTIDWELVVEKKDKKLIENPVQNFSSLPKEILKKEKSNQITSPMTLKIESPKAKLPASQKQAPIQISIQTPIQTQQQKIKKTTQETIQSAQKPTIQPSTHTEASKILVQKGTPIPTVQKPIQEPRKVSTKPTILEPQKTQEQSCSQISQSSPIIPAKLQGNATKISDFATVAKNFKPLFNKSSKSWLKEVKNFSILLVSVLTLFYFFTNAQLIIVMAEDLFTTSGTGNTELILNEEEHESAELKQETAQELEQLENRFTQIKKDKIEGQSISTTLQEFLDKKWEQHTIDFNTLPPGNRLIIPDLNINAPLIDTEASGVIDFSKENFDEELTKGVVKYPTTPIPGNKGNTLIFGHTSSEWWKKNEYGVIFRNIPKLKAGQKFYVIWNGKKTAYEMVERKVVRPKEVENYYHEFSDKEESYLTLMGCYPIWTADKRMMIVAKKIEE